MKHPSTELIHLYLQSQTLHDNALVSYWQGESNFHLKEVKAACKDMRKAIARFEAAIDGKHETGEAA